MNYAIYIAVVSAVFIGLILHVRWKRVKALNQKRREIDSMFNRDEIDSMTHCGLPLGDIHFYRPSMTKTVRNK